MIDMSPVRKDGKELARLKEQRLIRIAKNRTEKVLKYLRLLGNCSNTSNYQYTFEQVEKIYDAILEQAEKVFVSIHEAIENCLLRFASKTDKDDTFEF